MSAKCQKRTLGGSDADHGILENKEGELFSRRLGEFEADRMKKLLNRELAAG